MARRTRSVDEGPKNYREAGWTCLAAFMTKLGVDLSQADVTLEGSYVQHLKADYRYTVCY